MHKDVYSRAVQNVHNDQNLGMDPIVQELGKNPNQLCHINRILAGMQDACEAHEILAITWKDVWEIRLKETNTKHFVRTI